MTVEFLVCTIDQGIWKLSDLLMPPLPEVSYLVSWQHSLEKGGGMDTPPFAAEGDDATGMGIPPFLAEREDVRVVELQGRGLSRNRNNALRHAKGDLLVIADDDCRYTPECIDRIRQAFARHPGAAIIQFQGVTPEGDYMRKYPEQPYEYRTRPRFAFVSSWEMVLNRHAGLPQFDERFGLGAYLSCGEEDVFVHQTSELGLQVYYEPCILVTTPGGTTGTRFAVSSGVRRAKGGVLAVMHGPIGATLRCLKFAANFPGVGVAKRMRFFYEMLKGIKHVLTHNSLP